MKHKNRPLLEVATPKKSVPSTDPIFSVRLSPALYDFLISVVGNNRGEAALRLEVKYTGGVTRRVF